MKIFEILNRKLRNNTNKSGDNSRFTRSASFCNRDIHFDAMYLHKHFYWLIEFYSKNGSTVSVCITGDGDEFKVFSFILNCMCDFIESRDPENFRFYADEPSRIKLYHRILRRLPTNYHYRVNHGNEFVVMKNI